MEVVTFRSLVGREEGEHDMIVNPDVWSSDLPSTRYPTVIFTQLLNVTCLPDTLFISPSVILSLVSTLHNVQEFYRLIAW
jgi:hypothetical protein